MKMVTLALTGLLLTGQTFAMGGKGKEGKGIEHLQKELNLSDEQLEKAKEIKAKFKSDKTSNREAFKASRKDFKESMKNPNATNEELTQKFEAFQKLRDEHQRRRFNMMLEMRSILNPEQRAKFSEWRKTHKWKRKRFKKD